tara:strand:- start:371 stop:631 length:261 start_codon:yes stop_codon:yes gene_type:complete
MIRRYTESVNTRFEVGIVKLLDEALENQWCIDQQFNRSDLVRHLVRIGLKNFESNQPSEERFRKDTTTPSSHAVPVTKDDAERGSW